MQLGEPPDQRQPDPLADVGWVARREVEDPGSIAGGIFALIPDAEDDGILLPRDGDPDAAPPGRWTGRRGRSRPTRICSSRAGSASSASGPGDVERVSWWWRSSISGRTAATAARAAAAASSRCRRSSIFPRAMRERSSRSSSCRTRCLSCRSMASSAQATSSGEAARRARCRAPLMAATGLRRSCASRPRNSSLLAQFLLEGLHGCPPGRHRPQRRRARRGSRG